MAWHGITRRLCIVLVGKYIQTSFIFQLTVSVCYTQSCLVAYTILSAQTHVHKFYWINEFKLNRTQCDDSPFPCSKMVYSTRLWHVINAQMPQTVCDLLYSGQLVHSQVIFISTNLLKKNPSLLFSGQYLQWQAAVKIAAVCSWNKQNFPFTFFHPCSISFFHSVVWCIDRQPSTKDNITEHSLVHEKATNPFFRDLIYVMH